MGEDGRKEDERRGGWEEWRGEEGGGEEGRMRMRSKVGGGEERRKHITHKIFQIVEATDQT